VHKKSSRRLPGSLFVSSALICRARAAAHLQYKPALWWSRCEGLERESTYLIPCNGETAAIPQHSVYSACWRRRILQICSHSCAERKSTREQFHHIVSYNYAHGDKCVATNLEEHLWSTCPRSCGKFGAANFQVDENVIPFKIHVLEIERRWKRCHGKNKCGAFRCLVYK
jgi:hypothetical protein